MEGVRGRLKRRGQMYPHSCFILFVQEKVNNIVKQLYSNKYTSNKLKTMGSGHIKKAFISADTSMT